MPKNTFSKPSFFWLDYETWGANPRMDRAAQFAGIRTDEALNIIDEPVMIYCQPTPDFLPSPEAALITKITPQRAAREGFIEAEFFKKIHQELAKPNTCSVGYNSIRFDDEVTRFGFYRNFIDPYAYSWQNGNSRWDILDLVRMTYALRPEGIEWPEHEDGRPSFKLEHLTAANNIEHVGAHDALVDVKATINIAKLIKEKQPKLFEFYFKLRNKQEAARYLDLQKHSIVLHISGMFPAEEGCIAPIVPLLPHPVNANEIICFNLRQSPQDLINLSAEQIAERLYTKTLDLKENQIRIPLKGVHINKCPALAPVKTLQPELAEQWQIDWSVIDKHYQQLMQTDGLLDKLQDVYQQGKDFGESDTDAALYEGFITNEDRRRCNQLLELSPEQLSQWTPDYFQDTRLQTLLFRYRARNYPDTLNEQEKYKWQNFCQTRLQEGEFGATLTLEQFQQQLMTLAQQDLPENDLKVLHQLSDWVQNMFW